MCTPIFINTFVVFVRLYWFEKRFQNVVVEARNMRRQRTRSRTMSEGKTDEQPDLGKEENGVGNREIRVMRQENGHLKGQKIEDETSFKVEENNTSSSTSSTGQNEPVAPEEPSLENLEKLNSEHSEQPLQREIMFADEVDSPSDRLPLRNKDMSIAFVENQRKTKDTATFRIPGPRDYDRGLVPQKIDKEDDPNEPLSSEGVNLQAKRSRSMSLPPAEGLNADDHPLKNHITIDVPDKQRRPTTGASAYHMRRRGSDAEATHPANMTLRNRARTKSFSTFLSRDKEEEDPMPYLSWTPTVGRNSAFVDLSEEQREELGGIEYRALKLLLIILVCYFVGFHLLGMVTLLPWIVRDAYYSGVVTAIGESPVWW
jgi:hypothetical protein